MKGFLLLVTVLLGAGFEIAIAAADPAPASAGAEGTLKAYVTNFDGGSVTAIDLTRGRVVREIPTGANPHGVAIAPDGHAVYVSNESEGTVVVIDPLTDQVVATLRVGKSPHQVAVAADGRRVYVAVNGEHTLAVLDPAARSATKSVPVGRNPHIVAVAPDGKTLYVTSEGDGKVSIVDTASLEVTGEIPVFGFPRVLAVRPDGQRLFLTIRWNAGVLVIDPVARKVLDRWLLAEAKFDPEGKESHGPGVTPDGRQLWLTVQTTNEVVVADSETGRVLDRLPVGRNPNWIEFTPDGTKAVVSNTSSDDVSIIDVPQRRVLGTVKVGRSPKRLTIGTVSTGTESTTSDPFGGPTVENFDDVGSGELPRGWTPGVTGRGNPKWAVTPDASAPSKPNVLAQTGEGTFPFCVDSGVSLADGFAEVKFKPVSGSEDQAAGLVWRFKDKDDYYITRANALEDNVTIYHTVKGVRRAFKNVDTKVSPNVWHALRVEFQATHFVVYFDGRKVIEADDATIQGPGAVGVWTKADSRTSFDDFTFGPVVDAAGQPQS